MLDGGIFAPILPEVERAERLERLIDRERAHGALPYALRRLLALLPAETAVAADVGARLKLSRKQREAMRGRILCKAIANPRHAAYMHGTEAARDAALLYRSDEALDAALAALTDWSPPRFPLKGGDLIARGLEPGPDVGRKLHAIEARWIEEGFPDAGRLDALVAEQL